MTRYDEVRAELGRSPRTWAVTGVAGFIGSHLLETLLELGQTVRGLDDLSTGRASNLDDVRRRVGESAWRRFEWIEGDVADPAACAAVCEGATAVLHQAALGSVPRSMANPVATHVANVTGFLQMLLAARAAGIERFVYASSSSVYGDHPGLPKVEEVLGEPLSPYAATKRIDEIYATALYRAYGLWSAGLRYFNVFGPRQDPEGAYAAVIPRWIGAVLDGEPHYINGDGETSRDFCPVANVVQANLLAGTAPDGTPVQAYNVGLGGRTTLLELDRRICEGLVARGVESAEPVQHRDFRAGDVRHSLARIDRIRDDLGYAPGVDFGAGLERTLDWFVEQHRGGMPAGARSVAASPSAVRPPLGSSRRESEPPSSSA